MFHRLLKPLQSQSFFLFGARATGKTTLLKTLFENKKTLIFDFLKPELEAEYSLNPGRLRDQILSAYSRIDWVVFDEVQRVPKLLNIVHELIESHRIRFAITGSSARKLKRGKANLLAGRAFWNELFPLTHLEFGRSFDLNQCLRWGALPKIASFNSNEEKKEFLKSYITTYVQEEIKSEQLVRNLDPFRKFLEVAAQSSGKILNYTNIHRDVGVDVKTIQTYYSILEDTMMGYFLEPYESSVRKVLSRKPKFYLFDLGVQRALSHQLDVNLVEGTYAYGDLFEAFFILEAHRLNKYRRLDYGLYFLRTKDDVEIDLIVKRPGKPLALIEIKSSQTIRNDQLHRFQSIAKDFKNAERFCACQEALPRTVDSVHVWPWQKVLESVFS